MSLALLVPVPWAARVWALAFLTALCPSERYGPYVRRGRRHKPLVERARGLPGQLRRWLPERALIVVADSRYAALELLAWCAPGPTRDFANGERRSVMPLLNARKSQTAGQ